LISQFKELKSIKINKIKTSFTEFKNFYPAEDYHQQYYKKNQSDYFAYVIGCRRMEETKRSLEVIYFKIFQIPHAVAITCSELNNFASTKIRD